MTWLWVLGAVVAWFVFASLGPGKALFWQKLGRHPNAAFVFAIGHPDFRAYLFKPEGGFKSILDDDWAGPISIIVPGLGNARVAFFGRYPDFAKNEKLFLEWLMEATPVMDKMYGKPSRDAWRELSAAWGVFADRHGLPDLDETGATLLGLTPPKTGGA